MAEYEEEYESYDEYEEYEEYEYESSDDEKKEQWQRGSSSSDLDEQAAGLMDPERLKVQNKQKKINLQSPTTSPHFRAGQIKQSGA
jgi:hypothetical protein